MDKQNIKIVQLGAGGEENIRGCHNLQGKTSFRQAAYIIKNSLAHFGTDSYSSHLAGIYNKPLCCLYAANYTDCVRPYWGDRGKQILLEADRGGNAPSFSFDENPRTINTIKPEKIVSSICSLLNLPFEFPYETVFIGDAFTRTYIELICNQLIKPQEFNTDTLVVRMDILFSEKVLFEQAKLSKVVIITDKIISLELLKTIKPSIVELIYEVKEDNDPTWVQKVQRLGIKLALFSYLNNDELNKYKLQYLDLPLIHQKTFNKPEILNNIPSEKLYIAGNRFILSNSKIYPSVQHYKKDITIPNFGLYFTPFIDMPETYKEIDSFWVLKKLD